MSKNVDIFVFVWSMNDLSLQESGGTIKKKENLSFNFKLECSILIVF